MRLKKRNQAGTGHLSGDALSSWRPPLERLLTHSEERAMYSARQVKSRADGVSHGPENQQATDARRLLLAGCCQKRAPQPIGFALSRFSDCLLDFGEFVWANPRRDKFPQGFATGLLRSADFSSHAKNVSVTRKLFLHYDNLCGTNIQVSNETALSSKEMAGTAAGESELTSSQPVSAGASRRESEMNAETFQGSNSKRRVRSLKVEAIGDFARQQVVPRIRIAGQWLEQAGFKPGHRVEVRIEQPGSLSLRIFEQRKEAAL